MSSSTLPTVDATTPLFIVLNAGSGRDDASRARDTIVDVLAAAKREHEVLLIERDHPVDEIAARAVERAQACGGAVVAAGGDGTINAVAQAVVGSGCALGVVPQGTFNYFSRTHGIPSDTEAATRALLRAVVAPVQVGLVNDRVFLVNASLGLYPRLLENRESHKRRFGRSRVVALGSALATLFHLHRPLHLRMTHAGTDRQVHAQTLFIANNALQLRQIGVADDTVDTQLVAITLAPVGSLAMLRLMLHGAMGKLDAASEVRSLGFTAMDVTTLGRRRSRRLKVATDGETAWMTTPLAFRVSPEPLALLIPTPEDAVPQE